MRFIFRRKERTWFRDFFQLDERGWICEQNTTIHTRWFAISGPPSHEPGRCHTLDNDARRITRIR